MAAPAAASAAIAVTKPTFPLRARFTKLPSPSPALARSSHTLNVLAGKAYVFGGDLPTSGTPDDNAMHIITLPTDEVLEDTTDYRCVPAVVAAPSPSASSKPTSSSPDHQALGEESQSSAATMPAPRAAHASTVIGSTIYIFGGRAPISSSPPSSTSTLVDDHPPGTLHAFSATTHTWTALHPHPSLCSSGVPPPRTYPSLASSPHPLPSKAGEDLTLLPITNDEGGGGYGTVFLHGGYAEGGEALRDVWAFDVSSRVWARWPDVPSPDPNTVAEGGGEAEGMLVCGGGSRLWRAGGGGGGEGRVDWLGIVRDRFDDLGGVGELGVSPKSGRWESINAGGGGGRREVPRVEMGDVRRQVEEKMGPMAEKKKRVMGEGGEEEVPEGRRGAGLVALTTGQGREYLVMVMGERMDSGEVLGDAWSFQLQSEKTTAAKIKDTVRGLVGMQTGEYKWAEIEIAEATKEDGQLDRPKGLSRFGYADGGDWGVGSVVLWGGIGADGETKGDGWVLTVE